MTLHSALAGPAAVRRFGRPSQLQLGTTAPVGTCVQRDDDNLWYVCDGADPTAWPTVADPLDPQCTSCPQLPGGRRE